MKVSVIVPVYNVEAWLAACLDSLLEQGLSDTEYEIICVNDGSTDRSGEIARDYAERYRQIRVISQANAGLSSARNAGIREAAGEYAAFIDSDDLLAPNVLAGLYHLASINSSDQLLFGFARFRDGTNVLPAGQGVDRKRFMLFRDSQSMRNCKLVPAWRTAWNYLVRLSVLRKYRLEFPEGVIFEDAEFNFWLDRCVDRCGYLNQKLYYYRQREGSILRTFMSDPYFPRYIQGRIKLAAHHKARLEDYHAGILPELWRPVSEVELEERLIDEVQGILNRLLAKGEQKIFRQTLTALSAQGLYPYPMRIKRLWRQRNFRRQMTDVISFLFPVQGYLLLCMWFRIHLMPYDSEKHQE